MSLAGKRIVNTRAAHQAAALDDLLRAQGAIPLSYPCITIVPPQDTSALDRALTAPFDLLILTSANTVMILAERAAALGVSLANAPTAAVGEATAQAAREQLGVEVLMVPENYSADDLAAILSLGIGTRVLLPQSEIARPALLESLVARGVLVTALAAYRTVRGSGGIELTAWLRAGQVDAVTLTSSSTARFFVERLRSEGSASLDGVVFASIGEQTTQTARECGLRVDVEAQPHTLEGLVAGLAAHFQEQLT